MATPSNSSGTLLGSHAAIFLGGAFVIGLLVVAIVSALDVPRREKQERFAQVTAVGDTVIYQPPLTMPATPEPIATWQGRKMAPLSLEKTKIDDTDMRRLHRDEATGFTLYRPADPKANDVAYVKIAIGEYLPLVAVP